LCTKYGTNIINNSLQKTITKQDKNFTLLSASNQKGGNSYQTFTNQVATSNCKGSQTGQEVILISLSRLFFKGIRLNLQANFDLFFCARIFENLTGIEKYLYQFCEFVGCNFIFFQNQFSGKDAT